MRGVGKLNQSTAGIVLLGAIYVTTTTTTTDGLTRAERGGVLGPVLFLRLKVNIYKLRGHEISRSASGDAGMRI